MALCLNRKQGESVLLIIPPSDRPTVVRVEQGQHSGKRGRLLFYAPDSASIVRTELIGRERPLDRFLGNAGLLTSELAAAGVDLRTLEDRAELVGAE